MSRLYKVKWIFKGRAKSPRKETLVVAENINQAVTKVVDKYGDNIAEVVGANRQEDSLDVLQ